MNGCWVQAHKKVLDLILSLITYLFYLANCSRYLRFIKRIFNVLSNINQIYKNLPKMYTIILDMLEHCLFHKGAASKKEAFMRSQINFTNFQPLGMAALVTAAAATAVATTAMARINTSSKSCRVRPRELRSSLYNQEMLLLCTALKVF